eukprot:SAG31_NODE_10711_length_1107_cov_1.629960_1_plen_60_part_10
MADVSAVPAGLGRPAVVPLEGWDDQQSYRWKPSVTQQSPTRSPAYIDEVQSPRQIRHGGV